MRIHLVDPDINIYRYKKMRFKEGYLKISPKKLTHSIHKFNMDYLYHLVGYQSILIQLYCKAWYWLEITADTIELEWIEK
ncbi:MAG: hypothetical protein K2K15_01920 [Anaeroplasmataceae bacterium]|nr:hypothetical protein [Anaeroplasmataceae bacterium]